MAIVGDWTDRVISSARLAGENWCSLQVWYEIEWMIESEACLNSTSLDLLILLISISLPSVRHSVLSGLRSANSLNKM